MRPRLGWLFALAVVLPSALLAALAARAIRREEAYIEKQLATGLGAEVLQLAASVGEELRRAEEELARSAPGSASGSAPGSAPQSGTTGLAAWRKDSTLVGVPYLLTASYDLAQPRSNQGAAEREFLRRHGEFLAGRQQSPVYTNIALAFKDEILSPAGAPPQALAEAPAGARADAGEARAGARVSAAAAAPEAEAPAAETAGSDTAVNKDSGRQPDESRPPSPCAVNPTRLKRSQRPHPGYPHGPGRTPHDPLYRPPCAPRRRDPSLNATTSGHRSRSAAVLLGQ